MAVDYFLKIDGIAGESKDLKHKDAIDLESFSWGLTNEPVRTARPASGKAAIQDFHFVTRMNKASPALFLACATGKHIKYAVLSVRKAGMEKQDYLIVKMSDVVVSSYQTGGSEGADSPLDQVSFDFGRIDVEYRATKPDGTLAAAVKAGWDVTQSRAV